MEAMTQPESGPARDQTESSAQDGQWSGKAQREITCQKVARRLKPIHSKHLYVRNIQKAFH